MPPKPDPAHLKATERVLTRAMVDPGFHKLCLQDAMKAYLVAGQKLPPKAANLRFVASTDGKASVQKTKDGVVVSIPNPHVPAGRGTLSESRLDALTGGASTGEIIQDVGGIAGIVLPTVDVVTQVVQACFGIL